MTTPFQRKHPLAVCEACPLRKRDCAPTSGPRDAKIALVSRSPGTWDAQAHKPFSGPSGRVLDHLLEMNGVKREEILTTNVVLCETDNPPMDAIVACSPRLQQELENVDTIIAAGVEAVHALINQRATVSGSRRRNLSRLTLDGRTQRVVATTNPAAVLRESGNFPDMVRDFRFAINPTPPPKMPDVYWIDDEQEALETIYDELMHKPQLASDLETFGYSNNIACAGFAFDTTIGYVFGNEAVHNEKVRKALKELYEADIEWVWHNGKYDVKVLMQNGINGRIDHDTFLLSYALDERPGGDYRGDQGAGLHALTPTLMAEYGWPNYERESVREFKRTQILKEPLELYDYNGKDTVGTLVLFNDYVPAAKLDDVYEWPYLNVHIPLANALIPVELRGFHYNVEKAADLNENIVLPRLRELTQEMRDIVGLQLYNPRSNQQNKGLFYEKYGLKHKLKSTHKKQKAESTDKDVRKEIKEGRFTCIPGKEEEFVKFINLLDTFTQIDYSRSHYIEGLIKEVADDGKLYSTFKFGTVTGRTSSENPNFQNITRTGSNGLPSMRELFEASPGCRIVQADYSQAELRTVAKLSGDDSLLAIYRDSTRSLHRERAANFYGEDYDKEQYTKAKNMNFGITYGQSAMTFAQLYTIPQEEAQKYIDAWWRDFPKIADWVRSVAKTALTEGTVVSPFGHKRRFHLITRENRDEVVREAVNFLPQNIAGVLTELALCKLVLLGVPIVSTVHDSIVADVPLDEVDSVAMTMKRVMEQTAIEYLEWVPEDIPFLVDISIGEDWGNLEEIEVLVA